LYRTQGKLSKEEKMPAGVDLIEQTLLLVAQLQTNRKNLEFEV
jgi:hypothetical protein